MASKQQVKAAVAQFATIVSEDGGVVELDEIDLDSLTEAVNDERGHKESVLLAIIDLHDTIGLDQFGIFVE